MAKGMEPSRPAEGESTLADIHLAMRRLQRRISDVEKFDPTKVRSQQDPNIRALEAAIKETLSEIFGPNSRTYRSYAAAATLDTAGLNMNGTPLDEVIEGLVRGKERSLTLLNGAIRLFEEKIEDILPAATSADDVPASAESRTDGQVALSATTAIHTSGRAQLGAAVGIGKAGEIRTGIHQDDFPVVASSGVPFETRIETSRFRLTVQAIAQRMEGDVDLFAHLAANAAQQIQSTIEQLEAQKPNEPDALDGYANVSLVLNDLKSNFETIALELEAAKTTRAPALKASRIEKAAQVALKVYDEVIAWFDKNPGRAGLVIAQAGLAGTIAGALGYTAGVPPTITFPVVIAGLNGVNMWEAIKLFAKKGSDK